MNKEIEEFFREFLNQHPSVKKEKITISKVHIFASYEDERDAFDIDYEYQLRFYQTKIERTLPNGIITANTDYLRYEEVDILTDVLHSQKELKIRAEVVSTWGGSLLRVSLPLKMVDWFALISNGDLFDE